METITPDIDTQIAQRLKAMRLERGWSLDDLAKASGVSRATLSRLENAEVSATATVLGKLCAAHGMTLSRLLYMVEDAGQPLFRRDGQAVLNDPAHGFVRRSVSPPSRNFAGEVISCTISAGQTITYARPPREGVEHHLVMLSGCLFMQVEGASHRLEQGDCLRYRLTGPSEFHTGPDQPASYMLFIL